VLPQTSVLKAYSNGMYMSMLIYFLIYLILLMDHADSNKCSHP
jgi:hypothetical protein